MSLTLIIIIITFLAILLCAFTNGIHNISNVIVTMVSSGALDFRKALLLVAFFEFVGPLLGGTMVAGAVMSIIKTERIIAEFGSGQIVVIVLASVLAAISWNLITWHFALPSSSSHALIGGLVGSALAATRQLGFIAWGMGGGNVFHLKGFSGVMAAMILSPILGFIAGFTTTIFVRFLLRGGTPRTNHFLKRAQIFSSSALAFSHGSNDVQKSMGLMALVLLSISPETNLHIPFYVKFVCAAAIMLGALTGGRRIMKTVGRGIFRLKIEHGFNAQLASTIIILGNSLVGGPVSTIHVMSTTVMGVGTAVRSKAVRWNKVGEIALAWITTLPATFLLGALIYFIISPLAKYIK